MRARSSTPRCGIVAMEMPCSPRRASAPPVATCPESGQNCSMRSIVPTAGELAAAAEVMDPAKAPAAAIATRLAGLAAHGGDLTESARWLAIAQAAPDRDDLAAVLAPIAARLAAAVPVDRTLIAVLLPLSGRFAPLGKELKLAIELAPAGGARRIFLDTLGEPAGAAAAVERAAAQGAVALLGPVGVHEAEAAARRAVELDLPIALLAPGDGADPDAGVFRLVGSPESEARAAAAIALALNTPDRRGAGAARRRRHRGVAGLHRRRRGRRHHRHRAWPLRSHRHRSRARREGLPRPRAGDQPSSGRPPAPLRQTRLADLLPRRTVRAALRARSPRSRRHRRQLLALPRRRGPHRRLPRPRLPAAQTRRPHPAGGAAARLVGLEPRQLDHPRRRRRRGRLLRRALPGRAGRGPGR